MDFSGNESEHWCAVIVCVPASVPLVPVLTPLVNLVCEVRCPPVPVSDCEIVGPQTFSFSRKRGASVAPECEAKMNIAGSPVKAKTTPVRAVPERVRSGAPPPPEGTPLQQTAPWPGPPKDPPVEVDEMEVRHANPPWSAREGTLIENMESYLLKSEELQQGTCELEYFLLGPGDEEIRIVSLAVNARDEGGCSRCVVFDTRRGKEVADAAHLCEEARTEKPRSEDLEEEVKREARRHYADGRGKKRTLGKPESELPRKVMG